MKRLLLILCVVVSAGIAQISARDPRWRTNGVGALAARPATCTPNRDLYICNGLGCTTNGEYHYCTALNTYTVIGGGGGGMVYPGAGVAVSTGAAWGASFVAASANTPGALVLRDGGGNFAGGTFTGAVAGNASSASALAAIPSPCGVAGTYATAIAANGNLTCAAPSVSGYVLGAAGLTTLGRIVNASAAGTVAEIAGLTYNSGTAYLSNTGSFKSVTTSPSIDFEIPTKPTWQLGANIAGTGVDAYTLALGGTKFWLMTSTGVFSLPVSLAGSGNRFVVSSNTGVLSLASAGRVLLQGTAAKCQSAVAGASFGLPAANAPTPTCDVDGQQAYLTFTAGSAQTIYDRIEVPADWLGSLNLVITAWSTGANAPTINAYVACIAAAATTNPTYGGAQAVSLTPGAASARTRVSTTLTTTGCAATNALYLKIIITANVTDLNLLTASLTE